MPQRKPKKIRSRTVVIKLEHAKDVFSTFWPFRHEETFELEGVKDLRHLLSNEKARILFIIRTKNPSSIYELAKILGRDFKSVRQDVKLLERFGLIKLKKEGRTRQRLRPLLNLDQLNIVFKI